MSNEKSKFASKLGAIKNLIATISSLLVAIISVMSNYATLPKFFFYGALLLLLIGIILLSYYMFILPLLIRTKQNRLSRKLFNEFKDRRFVKNFRDIIATEEYKYFPFMFQNIISELSRSIEFKGKIESPPILSIQNYFHCWHRNFSKFNGTTEDFYELIWEFGTVVGTYYDLCIKISKNKLSEDDIRLNIPEQAMNNWTKAVDKYNNFARLYNEFSEKVNEELFKNDLERKIPGVPLAEEL